ncbi:MAG: replication factor C large subunit [Candidatus Nanohaloarchaea archaeon]|nr:replication factor C large subunit [Candidatus Nanohaloarchaea archaeon]
MAESINWTEKYRPESLDDYRGKSKTVDEVLKWVKNWENRKSQALLLHGPPGIGKTALVAAIANELDMELFETNASDVRTKQALRDNVEQAVKQRSFTGRDKLILIDEVDGMTANDRGGRSEINTIIEESRFPVILTANDAYANGMQTLRRKSKVVEVDKVHTNSIKARLREIAEAEGLTYDEKGIKAIARRADGDLRSAINDLQSLARKHGMIDREAAKELGYRDQEKDIFEALKIIFKTTTAATASDALDGVDEDHDTAFEWIRENVPREYDRTGDVARAMDELSKADVFRGRIGAQNWSLLKYVYEIMTVGVALSKEEKYGGFTRYQYPSRIKKMGRSKGSRKRREDIGVKVGDALHVSVSEASDTIPFLQQLFQKEEWRENIVEELDLTEDEVEFIEAF